MKKRSGGILSRFAAVACMATVAGVAGAAPFTPGTVVVSQFGNGVTASGTVPITLREFTTSGSATGVEVALPVADAGANKAVVGPISNTGIGLLKRADGEAGREFPFGLDGQAGEGAGVLPVAVPALVGGEVE